MRTHRRDPRRGIVLIAVLLVVTLLALAAYQFSDSMNAELKAADSAARGTQARLFAASGVHYAAAVLSNADAYAGTLGGNPFDNASAFQAVPVNESAGARYAGYFSVVAPYTVDETSGGGGSTQFRFGATDESAKLNPNMLLRVDPTGAKLREMLLKLPNMTEDIADAIVDWIDADDEPRTAGAESSYYSALSPGYRCKNGPLDSVEELLLVRGVTPDLLFGSDRNRNGSTDANERSEGEANDRGWSQYLTVYSRERNVDVEGQPRTYLNDTDVTGTYDKMLAAGVPVDVADFILAYKLYGQYTAAAAAPTPSGSSGQGGSQNQTVVVNSPTPVTKAMLDTTKRGQSLATILGLVTAKVGISKTETTVSVSTVSVSVSGGTAVVRAGQPQSTTRTITTVYSSPLADPAKAKVALPILLDKFTTRKDAEIPARVNVNTAPAAVLATLPGLEETDVDKIVEKRPAYAQGDGGDTTFQSISWLYTEANITPAKVAALERYVTARPTVFRVQSVGYFENGGPAARVEAVVDTNVGQPRIVYWRDISELGKGFNLQTR